MRLAIATGTGPADWGLPIDWETVVTFELELAMRAAAIQQRSALGA